MDTRRLRADLYQAAVLFDEVQVTSIIDCCCELFPLKWVCLELIIPVLEFIEAERGLLQKRILSFASGVILLCLRKKAIFIHQDLPHRPHAPIIISGSVPYQDDELYGFIMSLLLATTGYRVIHIEGHSSFESLLSLLDIHNASAIVLHMKNSNQRSITALNELFGYLSSKEYSRSFDCYHKFVRKPKVFLSGDCSIPSTISITLEDVGNDVARMLFGKQIVQIKNDMMTLTNNLILSSCEKMRLAYLRLGVRENAIDVYPCRNVVVEL